MEIPINQIEIGQRFREDFGDIESLATSINRYGLLHPIVVEEKDGKYYLIAGERRLKAHIELGKTEIRVTLLKDLDELTAKEIEVEENIRRHNFSWIEEIQAKLKLDKIKRSIYGSAVKGHAGEEKWGLKETAQSLDESIASVSQDLQLARALAEFPELAKEKSKSAAFARFKRLKMRFMSAELSDRIPMEVDLSCIQHGDARGLIMKEADESFDLIVTDPPYGVDLDKQGEFVRAHNTIYKDDPSTIMEMLRQIFKEFYRVLKPDTNAYVWFAHQHYAEVKTALESAGFSVWGSPIIWNKESSAAPPITPYTFTSCYEPCFLCSKGKRILNKYVPNVLTIPRVSSKSKLHPTEKPVSLLQTLIEASSNAGERVLDAFAGSGSTLEAAIRSKRIPKGYELEQEFYDKIRNRLVELKASLAPSSDGEIKEELEEVKDD